VKMPRTQIDTVAHTKMYGNSVSVWQSRKAFGPNVKAQFSGEQLYTVEGKDSSLISGEQQPSPASVRKGKKGSFTSSTMTVWFFPPHL